jgi:type II secretory pathway pseudopilin PulG
MKRCPQCNRTYTDDGLSFCLDDGSPLTIAGGPPPSDPGATIQYPQARDTSPQPTIAYNPVPVSTPPPPVAPPPAWSPMPPPQTQKRSVWPWLLGVGAVLVLMGIGVVVLIFVVSRVTTDNNNNRANSNNANNANVKTANRNSNRNDNTNSNDNTNTSSTPTTFNDDFSAQTWGVGTWDDGRAWYSDEEYHMRAISGRFIVMYAPEKTPYYTKDATVKVGLRSIDGNPPETGYGLVVHGEKKDDKLEDYGFLIYNGPNPKYKIVLHKGGDQTNLIAWTSSSVIRTGTSPNQLEVRISGPKLDFYINGQFITSITDSANYKTGRAGFYTSDVGEVAFDDLEISK